MGSHETSCARGTHEHHRYRTMMKAETLTTGARAGALLTRHAVSTSSRVGGLRRLASKPSKRAGLLAMRSSEDDEPKGTMADIGLGDLEEVMEKASGGSTTTDMLPEDLDGLVKFLGSEDVDLASKLLVEKFGESLYRELGFTKQSETINGRLAMVGFTFGFLGLFNGDILTQFAKSPLFAVVISGAIITATLVPTAKPDGYIPANIRETVMEVYGDFGGEDLFTPKAELINGRAAMLGLFSLVLLSIIF